MPAANSGLAYWHLSLYIEVEPEDDHCEIGYRSVNILKQSIMGKPFQRDLGRLI